MRVSSVHIQHFRSLYDVTIEFETVTVLIGANGSGKSSVLRALDWFFNGGSLDAEDVSGLEEGESISVAVTFSDLTPRDREALGSYATRETVTFWRTWAQDEGEKLTGRALAFPPFERVRAKMSKTELRQAYEELRGQQPDLELPRASSGAAAERSMMDWEASHQDRLEQATISATHLFGFVGQPRLAGRFDYAFVPAVFEAEEQMRDTRGTLLARLLERVAAGGERLEARLGELRDDVAKRVATVVNEEQGEALKQLAGRVTSALRRYIEEAAISLETHPPELKFPAIPIDMRVADGGIETEVSRQGHGFQRALLIATIHELATVEAEEDPPGLFLAIEEPELYQHPAQARHFARVLSDLASATERAIQVTYATHSPYFVDPERFERLRRFRKTRQQCPYPTTEVTAAAIDQVASRLSGLADETEIRRRIGITLQRTLSEAVFARAVLLVEGITDAALLAGVADREAGLDAEGIALVPAHGKTILPIAWGILSELGIPTYLVFDGDRGLADRMRADGKAGGDIEAASREAARWNRTLLSLLGEAEEDWPETRATPNHAVVADRLEDEFQASWPEMISKVHSLAEEARDRREKPEDLYRQAAREAQGAVPEFATRILDAARALR